MSEDIAAIFREEVRDLLESLERGLLDLKTRTDDMALVNQVFRDLHTVKGSGAMFGLAELAGFIHEFETVFDRVRSGALKLGPDILRLALCAKDEIPALVEGLPDPEGRRAEILCSLRDLMAQDPASVPVSSASNAGKSDLAMSKRKLRFSLSGAAFAMGARPEIVLDELRELGAENILADLSDLPMLDGLDVEACAIGWTMDLPATITAAQLEDVFLFVDADWNLVSAKDAVLASVQDAQSAAAADLHGPGSDAEVAPVVSFPSAGAPSFRDGRAEIASATVRVPAERLDALMDAVGELVILEARLTQLARESRDPSLITTAEQITRLSGGLRDATMSIRMVPMRSLVGRFRRLVMDLADKLGKPVEFVVTGEETELDKTVIEKLADPLVHILRNALDHGMETERDRAASGKPKTGRIELVAEHAGAEVLIRVRDDGRGMDPARICEKAVAQGLIAADATLTPSQIFALVFEPGFSTAEKVTVVSGRGVGMDVVRRTVESLRGLLEIDSALGQGTTVTLRLPLTLAIIEGLLIEIDGERYILPMPNVQEIVALPPDKAIAKRGGDFLDIRGRFVPFLRLRALFGCAGQPAAHQNAVIVMSGENRIGLVVDRIVGTNQTVIKQMSKLHASVRAISGATILGDGSVALILDVAHLIGMGRTVSEPPPSGTEVAA